MTIGSRDKKTPLAILRDILNQNETRHNTISLIMVLCQRVEALEKRVAQLEGLEKKVTE